MKEVKIRFKDEVCVFMSLSPLIMKNRAVEFVERHKDDFNEKSEAQRYWRDFFNIFGVDEKDVAIYEASVKKYDGSQGYADVLWKGKLVVEHKSKGKDLDEAFEQALSYVETLSTKEKPQYIITSDFQRIIVTNLKTQEQEKIDLLDLPDNLKIFEFIHKNPDKINKERKLNLDASKIMADINEELQKIGYNGEFLEVLLIRILFCLYAEDTGIFNKDLFKQYIQNINNPEDVGLKIQSLFRILNTPVDQRQTSLSGLITKFPYVNGKLFEKPIDPPIFTDKIVEMLLDASDFDWSEINPSIFGSLFQNIVDPKARRYYGAHYTSEENILKVINELFLDGLWLEFEKSKNNRNKLERFHEKIGNLKFFDPACGCGNFLIITYRELRELEYAILKILHNHDDAQSHFNADSLTKIKIDSFYGIEIEEFPARIAEVAMWFIQHQMDIKYESLDIHDFKLPLQSHLNIYIGDALEIEWEDILNPTNNVYILGNPPFVGSKLQSKVQKNGIKKVFEGFKKVGDLDYVCGWYKKAAEYIQNTNIQVCFVSTNSICQGEQASILWKQLKERYHLEINFAHQTFKWSNESKGKAAVYVIIIGFATNSRKTKKIFTYPTINSQEYTENIVENINNYLMNFKDVYISSRRTCIGNNPRMRFGSMPNDGGNLLLTPEEKNEILNIEPQSEKYIKEFISAKEFLNGKKKYCIWIENYSPSELQQCPLILERIDKVKEHRLKSSRKETRELAKYPTKFGEDRQPTSDYILVPGVSSENREYIPISFFNRDKIVGNSCFAVDKATLYDFGILTSKMHMVWIKYVAGRLKSDYRYSSTIVYNNFPSPVDVSEKLKNEISNAAQDILDIRENYANDSLAQLYNPKIMPPDLRKAHDKLDKLVDKAYSRKKFETEQDRIKFLFEKYESMI